MSNDHEPAGGALTREQVVSEVSRYVGGNYDLIRRFLGALEMCGYSLRSLQPQDGVQAWISVGERLPTEDCRVLAVKSIRLDGWQHVGIASFYAGSGTFSCDVTHWMPLPDAPQRVTITKGGEG